MVTSDHGDFLSLLAFVDEAKSQRRISLRTTPIISPYQQQFSLVYEPLRSVREKWMLLEVESLNKVLFQPPPLSLRPLLLEFFH